MISAYKTTLKTIIPVVATVVGVASGLEYGMSETNALLPALLAAGGGAILPPIAYAIDLSKIRTAKESDDSEKALQAIDLETEMKFGWDLGKDNLAKKVSAQATAGAIDGVIFEQAAYWLTYSLSNLFQ